jgi:hypothetical protein
LVLTPKGVLWGAKAFAEAIRARAMQDLVNWWKNARVRDKEMKADGETLGQSYHDNNLFNILNCEKGSFAIRVPFRAYSCVLVFA